MPSPYICVPDTHYRESRTRELEAYAAEGKIPVDVDLSQHPEKSVEARGCALLMLFIAVGRGIDSTCRAHGEGCRIHQRYQDRPGNVSRLTSRYSLQAQTKDNSVDELVGTAAEQLSTASSFVVFKAKL